MGTCGVANHLAYVIDCTLFVFGHAADSEGCRSDTSPTGRQLRPSLRNPAHSLKGA
jgi:hypothetical protein